MTTSIEVMKDLEHIRARHTMYTDSVDHATKEAIDNVVDEFQAGACTYLGVSLDTQLNQIIIADNGRGIPTDIHESEQISKFAVVFTKLHSSGKYKNREINNYNTTIGLNGVGVKVTSATSELFEAWTTKKTKTFKVVVEKGVLKLEGTAAGIVKEKIPPLPFQQKIITTVLRYTPDPIVFGSKYCRISSSYLKELCESLQYLCPSLFIELIIDGERFTYVSSRGIVGILDPKGSDIDCRKFQINNSDLDLVLWWNTQADSEMISSYVNCQKTKDGGTHVNALRSSITESFGDAGKSISAYLKEGLRCAFHLRISDPQFQGQNKHRLLNPEASELVIKHVTRNLELFLAENPKVRDSILQRATALKKAHETYKKDREAIKNLVKSKSKYLSLPDKLVSASGCIPERRELYLCEGSSAGGPIIRARTRPLYQEVYMLKGKITNSCRAEMGKVLANPDIIGVIQSIGCGILEDCDPKKARVGKVLLISDADSDGRHIDALLTAFFITYMAPLVEAGKLYRVKSPLYVATYREQHWYGKGMSDTSALADLMTKIPENLKGKVGKKDGVALTRFKGHGAASAEAIREYALGPSRELEMIRLPAGDAELVSNLMGDDVQARKELLAIDW
jgi:DNA gyrase subunit B